MNDPSSEARRLPARRYGFNLDRRYRIKLRGRGAPFERDDYAGWSIEHSGRVVHKWGCGRTRCEIADEDIEYTIDL